MSANTIDPELNAQATALTHELLHLITQRTAHSAVAMDALASACMNVAFASERLAFIPNLARQMMNHPMVLEACSEAPVAVQAIAPELVEEVRSLAPGLQELARTASYPEVALNALLTAYLNTANQQGFLPAVPGAAQALGEAAQALIKRAVPPTTSIAHTTLH